ncbi:hypothetical protein CRM22_001728 [Opisthorchis felineus]|uniref:Uncharacterized protein n=1 Tax=Opisthorchis felineus TaxID=147828 RepID=A0A4S2M995_OPIFE|nr:hypothetical protein CRM22_001728 [Opisthorchis felineus]
MLSYHTTILYVRCLHPRCSRCIVLTLLSWIGRWNKAYYVPLSALHNHHAPHTMVAVPLYPYRHAASVTIVAPLLWSFLSLLFCWSISPSSTLLKRNNGYDSLVFCTPVYFESFERFNILFQISL